MSAADDYAKNIVRGLSVIQRKVTRGCNLAGQHPISRAY
jgi:hypothetical protein